MSTLQVATAHRISALPPSSPQVTSTPDQGPTLHEQVAHYFSSEVGTLGFLFGHDPGQGVVPTPLAQTRQRQVDPGTLAQVTQTSYPPPPPGVVGPGYDPIFPAKLPPGYDPIPPSGTGGIRRGLPDRRVRLRDTLRGELDKAAAKLQALRGVNQAI